MNESGNFLIEVVREPIAADIKQQLLLINRRWKDVSEQARDFIQHESIERALREYRAGLAKINDWLARTEALCAARLTCNLHAVKDHVRALDVSIEAAIGFISEISKTYHFFHFQRGI